MYCKNGCCINSLRANSEFHVEYMNFNVQILTTIIILHLVCKPHIVYQYMRNKNKYPSVPGCQDYLIVVCWIYFLLFLYYYDMLLSLLRSWISFWIYCRVDFQTLLNSNSNWKFNFNGIFVLFVWSWTSLS